jgi:predicted dithiol-disulfide oxidoreductase (DUF899 family)
MRHSVVSPAEWFAASKAFLAKEKEFTRQRDQLSAERRALPWVKIDKPYEFDGPKGKQSLGDLFAGRSQLIVYHFMMTPGSSHRCTGCSFIADHIDGARLHLDGHDVSLIAVSRAPWREFEPFKERMGWRFPWVSSFGGDFNYDFHVSFRGLAPGDVAELYNFEPRQSREAGDAPGVSVFYKDSADELFHTYSSYGRGGDALIGAYQYLDLTPKGRNENGPRHNLTDWVRLHDQYDAPKRKLSAR